MTPALAEFSERARTRVDTALRRGLPRAIAGAEQLHDAVIYSLLQGGKRFRPMLTFAGAYLGRNPEDPLVDAAACAVECIHAYSLVHDDLPAMDDDALRRGEPTCHIAYGEATAILAGDALQAAAFAFVLNTTAPCAAQVAVLRELSRGAYAMVAGQAVDLSLAGQQPNLAQLSHMHMHKTGALIESALLMGALAGGVDQPTLPALRAYAHALGLAFQVHDDVLDVEGDTAVTGKVQGADAARSKPTFVSLLGLGDAKLKAEELRDEALAALASLSTAADPLRDLACYAVSRHK